MVHAAFYSWYDTVHKVVGGAVIPGVVDCDVEELSLEDLVTISYEDGITQRVMKSELEGRSMIVNVRGTRENPMYLFFRNRTEYAAFADQINEIVWTIWYRS